MCGPRSVGANLKLRNLVFDGQYHGYREWQQLQQLALMGLHGGSWLGGGDEGDVATDDH